MRSCGPLKGADRAGPASYRLHDEILAGAISSNGYNYCSCAGGGALSCEQLLQLALRSSSGRGRQSSPSSSSRLKAAVELVEDGHAGPVAIARLAVEDSGNSPQYHLIRLLCPSRSHLRPMRLLPDQTAPGRPSSPFLGGRARSRMVGRRVRPRNPSGYGLGGSRSARGICELASHALFTTTTARP
jgi:hypothetical protein